MSKTLPKAVPKAIIIDQDDNYLLLVRNEHPAFGNDADIPGGTANDGETDIDALVREVQEEIAYALDPTVVTEIYRGNDFSGPDVTYILYVARLSHRPDVTISWEHRSYEWVDKQTFLFRAQSAVDSYMHMTYAALTNSKL